MLREIEMTSRHYPHLTLRLQGADTSSLGHLDYGHHTHMYQWAQYFNPTEWIRQKVIQSAVRHEEALVIAREHRR